MCSISSKKSDKWRFHLGHQRDRFINERFGDLTNKINTLEDIYREKEKYNWRGSDLYFLVGGEKEFVKYIASEREWIKRKKIMYQNIFSGKYGMEIMDLTQYTLRDIKLIKLLSGTKDDLRNIKTAEQEMLQKSTSYSVIFNKGLELIKANTDNIAKRFRRASALESGLLGGDKQQHISAYIDNRELPQLPEEADMFHIIGEEVSV